MVCSSSTGVNLGFSILSQESKNNISEEVLNANDHYQVTFDDGSSDTSDSDYDPKADEYCDCSDEGSDEKKTTDVSTQNPSVFSGKEMSTSETTPHVTSSRIRDKQTDHSSTRVSLPVNASSVELLADQCPKTFVVLNMCNLGSYVKPDEDSIEGDPTP